MVCIEGDKISEVVADVKITSLVFCFENEWDQFTMANYLRI